MRLPARFLGQRWTRGIIASAVALNLVAAGVVATRVATSNSDSGGPSAPASPALPKDDLAGAESTPNLAARSDDLPPVALRAPVRCASKGSPTGGPLPGADERNGRRWVTVKRLTGNCDRSSSTFRLGGIDTRVAWRNNADTFAGFVVDVAQGREASAGFADAQCANVCSESQTITLPTGDYTLEVQAGTGPWEIEIQEYR